MTSRLVLGCGSAGKRIVEQFPREDIFVVDDDPDVVASFREEGIEATRGDPTDPAALEDLESPAVVFVAGDDAARNRLAIDRARERFPSSSVVVYLDTDLEGDDRETLTARADHVVDSRAVTGEYILERTDGEGAKKARALGRKLSAIDGTLAVVTHDNPDPDAIASAVALADIADAMGTEAEACYFGEISHQENRAMVNLLDLELRNLVPDDSLAEYAAFALVDHSRPGVNDGLPEDLEVDVVIDHHPPRGPVPGEFVDLRAEVGATSTMLTEYITYFGLDFDRRTATALLYGVRVDTNGFTREVSSTDFEAAATLLSRADPTVLERIEAPTVEGETYETIARAIKNRTRRDAVVVASAGWITNRDALPQAAEQLLTMEGVDTTLVFGFLEEMVFVSARSRDKDVDLGETLRDAYDAIGSAGGHADMAGAQLEIGMLAGTDDEREADSLRDVVEEVLTDRFFEAIRTAPGTPVGAYSQTSELLFSTGVDDEGESA
ncbi:DHH family phosphoesterase [Natrialbaceae archaeon A-gly3]